MGGPNYVGRRTGGGGGVNGRDSKWTVSGRARSKGQRDCRGRSGRKVNGWQGLGAEWISGEGGGVSGVGLGAVSWGEGLVERRVAQ